MGYISVDILPSDYRYTATARTKPPATSLSEAPRRRSFSSRLVYKVKHIYRGLASFTLTHSDSFIGADGITCLSIDI